MKYRPAVVVHVPPLQESTTAQVNVAAIEVGTLPVKSNSSNDASGGYTADRPYDPRPYDSRYARDYDYDRRDRRGRYDDYRRDYDRDRYDRERYGGRDRDRDYDRDRGRYDDRRY